MLRDLLDYHTEKQPQVNRRLWCRALSLTGFALLPSCSCCGRRSRSPRQPPYTESVSQRKPQHAAAADQPGSRPPNRLPHLQFVQWFRRSGQATPAHSDRTTATQAVTGVDKINACAGRNNNSSTSCSEQWLQQSDHQKALQHLS